MKKYPTFHHILTDEPLYLSAIDLNPCFPIDEPEPVSPHLNDAAEYIKAKQILSPYPFTEEDIQRIDLDFTKSIDRLLAKNYGKIEIKSTQQDKHNILWEKFKMKNQTFTLAGVTYQSWEEVKEDVVKILNLLYDGETDFDHQRVAQFLGEFIQYSPAYKFLDKTKFELTVRCDDSQNLLYISLMTDSSELFVYIDECSPDYHPDYQNEVPRQQIKVTKSDRPQEIYPDFPRIDSKIWENQPVKTEVERVAELRENLLRNYTESKVADELAIALGGVRELTCAAGAIDVLTREYVIEVKKASDWKHAIGQVLVYSEYFPDRAPMIYLFGDGLKQYRELARQHCRNLGIAYNDAEL